MSIANTDLKQKTRANGEDVNKAIEEAGEKVKSIGETVTYAAQQIASNAKESFHDTVDTAKGKLGSLEKMTSKYCQSHPLKALGIALLSGFVLSRLLK